MGKEFSLNDVKSGFFLFVAIESALAAMLILTGVRLSSPMEFYKTYRVGIDQILIFCTTLVVTLMTDLLVGVVSGVILKLALHCLRGAPLLHLFKLPIVSEERDDKIILHLRGGAALFSNYLYLLGVIQKELGKEKKVVLDVSEAKMVDHTTLIRLKQLAQTSDLELVGLENLSRVANHELATHRAG